MVVIENIVDKSIQDNIEKTMLWSNFPWFFVKDATNTFENKQQRPCFKHMFVNNKKINSDYIQLINPILQNCFKKLTNDFNTVYQVRSFLQLPLSDNYLKDKTFDTPHIDLNKPHYVFLYYVKDSDGDTLFFNNKEELKITHRITPKKGSVVIFNGNIWHTAEQADKDIRCVINIDVIK